MAGKNTRRPRGDGGGDGKKDSATSSQITTTVTARSNTNNGGGTAHQQKKSNSKKRQKMTTTTTRVNGNHKKQKENTTLGAFSDPTACSSPVMQVLSSSSSSSSSSKQQLAQQQGTILSNTNTSSLLQDLIAPMSCDDFLQRAFRQHAVYIPAATAAATRTAATGKSKKKKGKEKNDATTSQNDDRMSVICQRLYNLNVPQILRNTASDSMFVWLQQQQQQPKQQSDETTTAATTSTRIQSIEVDNPDTVYALYQAGHSTYCRAPPDLEQDLVSNLLEDTGLGCGQYDASGTSLTSLGRGEVEVFISSPKKGSTSRSDTTVLATTGWHYDFQENFTLQLSGIKRWTLCRGTVRHPMRACTPHYASPESVEPQLKAARMSQPNFAFDWPIVASSNDDNNNNNNSTGPLEQVILRPGDVLYFPAGMWHKIEVLEPGVSINISLMATNYATLTCQALQHYLLQRPDTDSWRECIVAPRSHLRQQQPHDANLGSNTTSTTTTTTTTTTTAAVAARSSVVDHLNKLLHELPGIIQEFQRNGGAQAILPPVLHHGKTFANDDDDALGEDEDEKNETTASTSTDEEEEEQDMEVDHDDSRVSHDNEQDEQETDDSDDDDDDDDDDDASDLVDLRTEPPRTANITDFDPSRSALRERLDKYRLVKNPLAILIPENDITRFYNDSSTTNNGYTEAQQQQQQQQPPFVYVLNVNYAGNESHESCIRVRLQSQDHANLHQAFGDEVQAEKMARLLLTAAREEKLDHDDDEPPCHTIAWLVYLGFLVWVAR